MDIQWRFEDYDYGATVGVVGFDADSGGSHACRVRLDSATNSAKAREIGMRRVLAWLEAREASPQPHKSLKALWRDMRAAKQYEFADRLRAILVDMKVDLNG